MIYLDNAAASWPKPEVVYETLGRFLRSTAGVPNHHGYRMARDAARVVEDTRAKLAALLGVGDPSRVIFTSSATAALNLAVKGILSPGDHAVATTMEHDAVVRPLRLLEAIGVATSWVPADDFGFVDPADVERAIRPNTRVVAVIHASNVNGALQPVRDIAAIAHRHGALVLVDAAQTVGALPFTVGDLDADMVAIGGCRALLGPPGTGALVLGPRVDPDELSALMDGAWHVSAARHTSVPACPHRFEAGAMNTLGLAALGAAIDFIGQVGLTEVRVRHRAAVERLLAALSTVPGVRVLTPPDPDRRIGIVSVVVEGWDPLEFAAVLDREHGIVCGGGLHGAPSACRALGAFPHGTVRFSPSVFTTEEDIEQTVAAVRQLARSPLRLG